MRFFFGLIGLVVVLAIVGTLVKQQLASQKVVVPALQVPGAPAPTGNVREQSQQIQQQYKQALDAALQQPRPEPKTPE
mgnify:CR=1 FL=1|jgi:hypothetical protein